MNADLFIQKFDRFLDAPDAVAKLRKLVLDFAVKGALSEQRSDESVIAQLSSSKQFNAQRRKQAAPRAAEIPFEVPTNWTWLSIGESMEMYNGKAFKPEDWSTEGVPIIRIQNLNNEKSPFNRCNQPVEPRVHVNNGEFLISWSGTPGTSFGAFIWMRGFAYLNQHIFRCEIPDGVFIKEFLRLTINARLDEMISHAQGAVGLQHITKGKLESIAIPLPPLAEQKRIVAKVDEVMALCDRLESQLTEQSARQTALARAALERFAANPSPAELDLLFHPAVDLPPVDLRKSILSLAVQGKLVPQDPTDEPAAELIANNLTERRKLKRPIASEIKSIDGDRSMGFSIPASWQWQALDELLVFGPTNGFSPKAVDYETPVRSLTLSATTSGEFKGQYSKYITTEVPLDSDLWLKDGDILVQRGNSMEYVGVAAIYRGDPNQFIYPDLMMKLRVAASFDVEFIHIAMSHESARAFLRARASGTSGSMPKINQTTLRSLPIPIPPLAEQRRIVVKVNELMALVDRLEAQQTTARSAASALLDAAVAELISAPKPSAPVATPKDNITAFSRPHIRATLAAEIIDRIGNQANFGRVKLQKLLYLLQHDLRLDEIEADYHRDAAGPYDKELMREVDDTLRDRAWFAAGKNPDGGYTYHRLADAGQHRESFDKLWPQQGPAIRAIIDSMATWKTERCERLATVYGAWNDLLLADRPVTDDTILHEISHHWHPDKNKIPDAKWRETLAYLRTHGPTPTGYGHLTRAETEAQPELFV